MSCSYEKHDCHRTDFYETSYIIILLIFVSTFRFGLKSDKNNTLHEQLLTITNSLRVCSLQLRRTVLSVKYALRSKTQYVYFNEKVYDLHEYELKRGYRP